MADLGETLGYHDLAIEIAEELGKTPKIRVIQGPPGVGKSWLAKGVGTLWERAGGGVVVAEGDSTRSDLPFYPFGIAMDDLGPNLEALGTALAAVAKAGELLIGTGGVLTTSIEALVKLQASRKRKPVSLLDSNEQEILAKLARLGRRRPLMVIADNLHWWDSESLEFLSRLRDERIADEHPFLREMRILAVETPEPHQRVVHPKARDDLLLPQSTRVHSLTAIPREGFEDVLIDLGAPERPSTDDTDLIYRFSGGHLILARRCAIRLRENEAKGFLLAETPDEFVRDLLSERVRHLGSAEHEALDVLQVAAVSGLTFRRDTLECALDGSEVNTAKVLRHCQKEDLLELRNGIGRFVHDFYRQHFLNGLGDERAEVHGMLGNCMRQLDPGNYASRCLNAVAAEHHDEASELAVQAALERQRDGLPWRTLPNPILKAMQACELTWVVERLESALKHLNHYRSADCLHTLSTMSHDLPPRLVAEVDYLRATALLTTRSGADRREAKMTLESLTNWMTDEAELGLRFMQLRLYQLALEVDKEAGLRLEGEIRQVLHTRKGTDAAAKDALYILDRLAGRTQRASRALDMNRRAVEYFGPVAGQEVLRRPVEYYLSLVNLGATLINQADYDEASEIHRRIEALIAEFEPGVFRRIDYPMMNRLLSEHRAGAVKIDEAIRRQRGIVESHAVPDDPFFVESALAVYLTLAGAHAEALEVFDHLAALIANREEPEPSIDYLVRGNRCATRYVYGEAPEALNEWRELSGVVARIPYGTAPEMLRRHQLIDAAMSGGTAVSAKYFDEGLLNGQGLCAELAYGFWMPAVEWWR